MLLGSTVGLRGMSLSPPSSERGGGPKSNGVELVWAGVVGGAWSAKEGTVLCSMPERHGKYLSSNSARSEMRVWRVVGL